MALGQHRFSPVEVQAVSPTVDDDSSAGFDVGTIWVNVATDEIFLAADVSVGAAIWVGPVGGGAGGHTIRDDGVDQTARTGLNFIGPILVVTDDVGDDEQEISVDQGQISHDSIADVTPNDHHASFLQADADLLYEALGAIGIHAALVDVHHARLHDHSVTEDGPALVPESLEVTGGPLALSGDISPSLSASVNDWNPAGLADATVIRVTSNANRSVSGLVGGADGRVILLLNVGTFNVRLLHGGAGSAPANRFILPDNESMSIVPNEGVKLIYDSTTSRWRVAERGGAPAGVNYLVGTADIRLHNEIVVGLTPGGELGGTWGTPTVDTLHSGSIHPSITKGWAHSLGAR